MIEVWNGDKWVEGVPAHGQKYRKTSDTGSVLISYWNEINIDEFATANESITINGNPAITKQPIYFVDNGQSITIVSDIVNEANEVQTQIDSASLGYPPVLVVPVMKYANKQVVDEVYFQVTLVSGVITTTGTLPSAGNWQMKTDRVNDSLAVISADWKFSNASANFIVS